uniref:Beta-lactamase-like protein 2 homolog n=1 Tax=Plectus sambesii TaxID=2011161 RepID=A0A914V4L5_9BILA
MSLSNYVDYLVAGAAYAGARLFGKMAQPANLTPLEAQSKLSPLVYRVLGANPGPFTLQGTNTYLIGSGAEKILIDTGEPNINEFTESLKSALKALGDAHISSIVCTHWHGDHVGGVNDVIKKVVGREIPVHKLKRKEQADAHGPPSGYSFVDDGHVFRTTGATLKAVYTPGHTSDHMILVLEEENAILSGDCILGEGTSVFEDLHTYMQSLAMLLNMNPSKIYPGHGPVIENPTERIQQYIDHRNEREEQIISFLSSRTADESVSSMDIVNGVYVGISAAVKLGAVGNVKHHLTKLLKEGRVSKVSSDQWRLARSSDKPDSSHL